jgi:hypothetical protein
MTFRRLSNDLRASAVALFVAFALCPSLFAQGPTPDVPTSLLEPVSSSFVTTSHSEIAVHKFWDNQNRAFFAAAAALNAADFAVTRANLQSGGQELNPLVRPFGRSTSGLAMNFAGETAGVVTLSYFFHKTGHHKLERAVSIANIGLSAGAVTYGLINR